MNLLFVYPHAILPNRGGSERVAYTLAHALRKRGHQIWFMATKAADTDFNLAGNPEYILIPESLSEAKRKDAVIAACNENKIDVIINEGGEFEGFAIFSKDVLPKVKIITCLHFDVYGEIRYFRREEQYHNLTTSKFKLAIIEMLTAVGVDPYRIKFYLSKRRRYRRMLQVSDAIVVVTPVIANQLKRLTGINSDKIVPILNPLIFAQRKPTYDAAAKEKMLLYVGRFSPDKNVDKILQAWARIAPQHPEWKLEIAGDGEMRESLHAMVREHRIPRVHFHGHVTDVESLYNRAEYLLLASDCEALPCVLQEALTYGCHPIIFDYPSAEVIIPSPSLGSRIKRHTVRALSREITEAIAANRSNASHLKEIEEHLSRFNTDQILACWTSLLEQRSA